LRQLTFIEPRRLEWWEVEEPGLEGDGEALVRPLAVSTCDLDSAIVHGRAPFQGPFPFGHECVAEVVEVGGDADDLRAGNLVSVPFQISCGECEKCKAGHTGNCASVPRLSMYGLGPMGGEWGGFLSDLVRVPYARAMLVPLPEGASPEAAASVSDNVSDGWRTVAPHLAERPGAEVLVVGGTPSLGLYAAQIAVALGASRVDYVDTGIRLERAARFGANPIEGPPPKRLGPYPITVNASMDREGLACALRSTEPDGVCTSAGFLFEPETPVPLLEMYTDGITFHTGRVHARSAMPDVLRLVGEGKLDPSEVTTQVVPWDEADAALAEHRSKTVVSRL
jgi:threonine dehydrogenase-like Zn-dependent dehydrogenase